MVVFEAAAEHDPVFKLLREVVRRGYAEVAADGTRPPSSGAHKSFVKFRDTLLDFPFHALFKQYSFHDQQKINTLDALVELLARDEKPDPRNLSMTALESCCRHYSGVMPEYSCLLHQRLHSLVTSVMEVTHLPVAAVPHNYRTVAAVLAALKLAITVTTDNNNTPVLIQMNVDVQDLQVQCVQLYALSSLVLSRLCLLLVSCPILMPRDNVTRDRLNDVLIAAVVRLPNVNLQTIEHMENIGTAMCALWNTCSLQHLVETLKTIYAVIASKNPTEHLSAALAHVLTYVPSFVVYKLAPHILLMPNCNSMQNFKNTLSRLSVWLAGWPSANETLLLWIKTVVKLMARNNMVHVIEDVAIDVLPKWTLLMRMTALRKNFVRAATLLLLSCQESDRAYVKCRPALLLWGHALAKTELNKSDDIHELFAELCHALAHLFPGRDANTSIAHVIEGFPSVASVRVEWLVESHCWLNVVDSDVQNNGEGGDHAAVADRMGSLAAAVDRNSSIYAVAGAAGGSTTVDRNYVPTQGELSDSSILSRGGLPAGLDNIGSTCYYNAVMQALFATDPFRDSVVCRPEPVSGAHSELQELYSVLLFTEQQSISPTKTMLSSATPEYFELGYQQDASEFMGHLLDSLKESEMKAYKEEIMNLMEERRKKLLIYEQVKRERAEQLVQAMKKRQQQSEDTTATQDNNSSCMAALADHGVDSGSEDTDVTVVVSSDASSATITYMSPSKVEPGSSNNLSCSSDSSDHVLLSSFSPSSRLFESTVLSNCTESSECKSSANCADSVKTANLSTNWEGLSGPSTDVTVTEPCSLSKIEHNDTQSGIEIALTNGYKSATTVEREEKCRLEANKSNYSSGHRSMETVLMDDSATLEVSAARNDPSIDDSSTDQLASTSKNQLPDSDDSTNSSAMQEVLYNSYKSNSSVHAPEILAPPDRSLKRKGDLIQEDKLDTLKTPRDDVDYLFAEVDTTDAALISTTLTTDVASDDNSDSGISIQDDVANSNLDTASTVGGGVTEEEDMEEDGGQQPDETHDVCPTQHSGQGTMADDDETMESDHLTSGGDSMTVTGVNDSITMMVTGDNDDVTNCVTMHHTDDNDATNCVTMHNTDGDGMVESGHQADGGDSMPVTGINDSVTMMVTGDSDDVTNSVTMHHTDDDDVTNSVTMHHTDDALDSITVLSTDEDRGTFVKNIFGGKTVRLAHCLNCNTISENYDNSLDLKISFDDCQKQRNGLVALDDLISHSLKKQELNGSEQYFCEVCKGKQNAVIHTAVVKAPEFLILAQNRFIFNSKTREESKIMTPVDFEETLELPVWNVDDFKKRISDATSAVCVKGSCQEMRHARRLSNSSYRPSFNTVFSNSSTGAATSHTSNLGASSNLTVCDNDNSFSSKDCTSEVNISAALGNGVLNNSCAAGGSETANDTATDHSLSASSSTTSSSNSSGVGSGDSQDACSSVMVSSLPDKTEKLTINRAMEEDQNNTAVEIPSVASAVNSALKHDGVVVHSASSLVYSSTDILCINTDMHKTSLDNVSLFEHKSEVAAHIQGKFDNFSTFDTPPPTPEKPNNLILSPPSEQFVKKNHSTPSNEKIEDKNNLNASNLSEDCGQVLPSEDKNIDIGEVVSLHSSQPLESPYLTPPTNCNKIVPSPCQSSSNTNEENREQFDINPVCSTNSFVADKSTNSSTMLELSTLRGKDCEMDFTDEVDGDSSITHRESSRMESTSVEESNVDTSVYCSVEATTHGTLSAKATEGRGKAGSSFCHPNISSINSCGTSISGEGVGSAAGERYALYAIVVHSGKISRAGHYYSYTRSSSQAVRASSLITGVAAQRNTRCSEWVELNDSKAYATSFRAMKDSLTSSTAESTPYLMFYQKVSRECGQELAPTREEQQFRALPRRLQDIVRCHLHYHRTTHTRHSTSYSSGGRGGPAPQPPPPRGGGGPTIGGPQCGENVLNVTSRFIY